MKIITITNLPEAILNRVEAGYDGVTPLVGIQFTSGTVAVLGFNVDNDDDARVVSKLSDVTNFEEVFVRAAIMQQRIPHIAAADLQGSTIRVIWSDEPVPTVH